MVSSLVQERASGSEGRTDASLPLETTYTVQKLGQRSEIRGDKVCALGIQ